MPAVNNKNKKKGRDRTPISPRACGNCVHYRVVAWSSRKGNAWGWCTVHKVAVGRKANSCEKFEEKGRVTPNPFLSAAQEVVA